MKTIDPATVPPKMSKIERLMHVLEKTADHPTAEAPDVVAKAARDARQLILDLLGMSEKPKGEQIYAHWLKAARAVDTEGPPGLRETLLFISRFNEDTFPASDDGKIPFGRALLEMAIDAIRGELKRQEQASKPGDDGL